MTFNIKFTIFQTEFITPSSAVCCLHIIRKRDIRKREDCQMTVSTAHHNLQQKAAFDNHIWRTGNSLVCQCISHSTHLPQPFPMTDSAEVKLLLRAVGQVLLYSLGAHNFNQLMMVMLCTTTTYTKWQHTISKLTTVNKL